MLGLVFLLVAVTMDLGCVLLAVSLPRTRLLRRLPAPIYLGFGTYAAVTA